MKVSSLMIGHTIHDIRHQDNDRAEATPMKVHVGSPVPSLRLHAMLKGEYAILDRTAIADRWVVLCFLAGLRSADVNCLNRQASLFGRLGAVLLVGVPDEAALFDPVQYRTWKSLAVPVLTDPLYRLRRTYGIPQYAEAYKARTFLIDPAKVLRHHIVHDLTMWNMDSIRELMSCREPQVPGDNRGQIEEGARHVVRAS